MDIKEPAIIGTSGLNGVKIRPQSSCAPIVTVIYAVTIVAAIKYANGGNLRRRIHRVIQTAENANVMAQPTQMGYHR